MSPRIGSLFSGYGGLDMGVQAVIGGEVAWHVEFDAAPSRILEHRFPGVPNYGDITAADWSAVESVDVLTGGFPCQDVSIAGSRAGLREGTRSGLWSEFAKAIGALQPGLVVIENVRGLLSAEAAGPVESDPWALGDGAAGPTLRALGAVLGNLAELGYDARWGGFRAADAGAPHGRFRVFIVAHPAGEPRRFGYRDDVPAGSRAFGRGENAGRSASADAHQFGWGTGQRAPAGREAGGTDVLDQDAAADTICERCGDPDYLHDADGFCAGSCGGRCYDLAANAAGRGRDRWAQDSQRIQVRRAPAAGSRRGADVAADTDGDGFEGIGGILAKRRDADGPHGTNAVWGSYEPAVRRWEQIRGHVAPSPTEPTGKGGAQRLSPRFVEWMMGLPEGWVTSPDVGLTRTQQLKALGNGVVPQQAALAVRTLFEAEAVAA